MAAPTITVTADPEALQAAMEALTAYNSAVTKYEEAESKATEAYNAAVEKATEAHAAAVGKAKGELDIAEKAAKSAGVNFSSAPARKSTKRASGGSRVSGDQVKANVLNTAKSTTSFKLSEVTGGGSPATISKAVKELVEEGKLVEVGPDPSHSGRGRAPVMYAKA